MLKLKTLALTVALAGAMAVSGLAMAQGGKGGGGGGSGGGGGGGSGTGGMMTGSGDMDRLRDPDRDRLYLGTQDRLRTFDRDGDHQVNRVEFEDMHKDMFDKMDTDGNGLSLEEYHAARFGAGPYSNANTQRQMLMREQANLRKTERFRIMDGNGDGIVSREEYMRFGEHTWLEADTNDDGRLSWGELQAYNRGM